MSKELAESHLTKTFVYFISKSTEVYSCRRTTSNSLQNFVPAIYNEHHNFINELCTEPDYKGIVPDKEAFLGLSYDIMMAETMTNSSLKSSQSMIDNFSIVFMHSIFESAIFKLIETIHIIDQQSFNKWLDRVELRLTLKQIEENASKLRDNETEKFFYKLERESLKEKIEKLISLLPNKEIFKHEVENYQFNFDRIINFDRVRHEIVHEHQSIPEGFIVYKELKYVENTFLHFFSGVSLHYGLKISPTAADFLST